MVSFLAKLFIKNRDNYTDTKVRSAYGVLCGALGIMLNIILCGIKFIAAAISGSVSITADAMNNLSDAGSSLVTLIGFKLASQKPDSDHPFGHGRLEYISGFIVSMLILLMGFELGKESLSKITGGSDVEFSVAPIVILAISILVKLYMFFYNSRLGTKLSSSAMKATASDCLVDCISTGVVLICTVAAKFTDFNLDGWCGLAVAVFILWSGIKTAKETLDPLLGMPPEPEFVESIKTIVMSYPNVSGIHDLIVHNYGPGRVMISLHAEMPQDVDVLTLHDTVDNIEQELTNQLGCHAVIHLDPVATGDSEIALLKQLTLEKVKEVNELLSIHDFRTVIGQSHTNLIFDVTVPYEVKMTDAEVRSQIALAIKEINENYFSVIHIDRLYTTN